MYHISRLSIQDRVLDLSVKKDSDSMCSQPVEPSASASAVSSCLAVHRTELPDKPSSPLPHLYVSSIVTFSLVSYVIFMSGLALW